MISEEDEDGQYYGDYTEHTDLVEEEERSGYNSPSEYTNGMMSVLNTRYTISSTIHQCLRLQYFKYTCQKEVWEGREAKN